MNFCLNLDLGTVNPLKASWQLVSAASALPLIMIQISRFQSQKTSSRVDHQYPSLRHGRERDQILLPGRYTLKRNANNLVAFTPGERR